MLALMVLFLFGLQPSQARQITTAPDQARTEKLQRKAIAYLSKRGIEVEFTGNKVFSSQALLALLASDKSALGYLGEGAQSPDHLDVGLRYFRNRLATRGYLQASVGEPKIERTVDGHKFIIPINEGARYRVGKISFEGAQLLSPEQLNEMFPLKQGDVANGQALYMFAVENLRKIYFEHGYLQYMGEPEPTYHLAAESALEGIVDYHITIDEGVCFKVHTVEFVGNAETPDRVVRSALRLREDEPFKMSLLEESLKNIKELNLFEEISTERDVDYAFDEEQALVKIKINLKERINLGAPGK